jgi:hypothetical protein
MSAGAFSEDHHGSLQAILRYCIAPTKNSRHNRGSHYILRVHCASHFALRVLDLAMQIQAEKHGSQLDEIAAGASAFAAMTALKHETRSYENEVRVVHAQRILPPQDTEHKIFSVTSLLPDGEEWRWRKPLERQSGGQIISYLAFLFGRYRNKLFEPAEAIERVILGPKCTLSLDETTSLLQAHGFRRFQIARSNCQIR